MLIFRISPDGILTDAYAPSFAASGTDEPGAGADGAAGGAEDDVGLRAFPGPAESLAVGKIDSGSVVGERQRLDAE